MSAFPKENKLDVRIFGVWPAEPNVFPMTNYSLPWKIPVQTLWDTASMVNNTDDWNHRVSDHEKVPWLSSINIISREGDKLLRPHPLFVGDLSISKTWVTADTHRNPSHRAIVNIIYISKMCLVLDFPSTYMRYILKDILKSGTA